MPYPYVLVDVFSDAVFRGNQLAVVTEADGLAPATMQAIAKEFGFAETAFVLRATGSGTHRLRIFTPAEEMPFAGHPTLGAAAALARECDGPEPERFVFEEGVGDVQIAVHRDQDGKIYSQLDLDTRFETADPFDDLAGLATVIGLDANAVRGTAFASAGVRFCFCRVATTADVDAAVLDLPAWARTLRSAWAAQLFVFAESPCGTELYGRMFAPALGVPEDAATGSAAAALALSRAHAASDGQSQLVIRQGHRMGRPSTLHAAARKVSPEADHVSVGGHVAVFAEGNLRAPGV